MSGTRKSSGTWITFVVLAIVGLIFGFLFLRAGGEEQSPATPDAEPAEIVDPSALPPVPDQPATQE